jgi:acyl-CoA synthetase (AMP-forming)/AMP-acid ligase II
MKPMTNAAAWKGLEPTLGWIIRRRVKKHPEAEALVMVDGRRYTYAHLNDRLNRLSNAFSRFGVR